MAKHPFTLRVVVGHAWREKSLPTQGTSNFLALSRGYRCRELWESIKDSYYRGSLEGLVHAGMGYRCEWEDVLCTAFDVSWRNLRDCCSCFKEWLKLFPQFAATVCEKWGLPSLQAVLGLEAPAQEGLIQKRRKVLHPLEDLPRDHGDKCPPVEWWRSHKCFCFIVDCLPLAQVICGHVPLSALEMAPMFERMAGALFNLVDADWICAKR